MELQVILNDVARIMDIPFNHSNNAQQNTAASQTNPAEGNWSNPISPVSSSSNENFSNDASEGIFPWGDELRFALDDVKVGYRTAVEGGRIALAAGTRKRKRWCDMDAAPPPQLAKIPSSVVGGGQDMGFVDEEVMVEPILGDCGAGSKRDNNVVVRYKDTKDPLEDTDQNKEEDKALLTQDFIITREMCFLCNIPMTQRRLNAPSWPTGSQCAACYASGRRCQLVAAVKYTLSHLPQAFSLVARAAKLAPDISHQGCDNDDVIGKPHFYGEGERTVARSQHHRGSLTFCARKTKPSIFDSWMGNTIDILLVLGGVGGGINELVIQLLLL
uniref:Uncharacterized protein n=1 Tax=Timema douglasi TaxID=61478 RepID=A0A7R8Z684_TIMDO|nr:unnamed protein product [Timema douglasi]